MKCTYYDIFTNYGFECRNHVTSDHLLAVWDDEDLTERVKQCYGESVAKDYQAYPQSVLDGEDAA